MASLADSEIGKEYEHCPNTKGDQSNKNSQEGVNPKLLESSRGFQSIVPMINNSVHGSRPSFLTVSFLGPSCGESNGSFWVRTGSDWILEKQRLTA